MVEDVEIVGKQDVHVATTTPDKLESEHNTHLVQVARLASKLAIQS